MSGQRLKGELALVTGSDSGIGQANAIALAKESARHIHGTTIVVDGALMLYQGQGA